MLLNNLTLKNYRNHKKMGIDFSPGINFITGLNGSGKTNILEAIHFLSTTKSFRARYDMDLINHEAEFAIVQAKILKNEVIEDMEIQVIRGQNEDNRSSKRVKYNNVPKSLNSFASKFTTVLFSPESLNVITGSPTLRRSYIDSIFYQVDDQYKKDLSEYKKALKQRNKVLELIGVNSSSYKQLPFWNDKIVTLGTSIQKKRAMLFKFFEDFLLSEGKGLYEINYGYNPITQEKLTQIQYKEVAAKRTLLGPHLDDFVVKSVNEGELAQFGSRGQQRDAIFILKLAEISYLETNTKERPVLLLDDIFSELDDIHREKVLALVKEQQTIITSAENVREIIDESLIDKLITL